VQRYKLNGIEWLNYCNLFLLLLKLYKQNIMKKACLVFVVLLSFSNLFAQYENIIIDNEGTPEEPSIMINPNNPDQLVAGSNINNYYYSEDGGYNWTKGQLTSPEYGVWGDPCIIVDTAGSFYFLHLSSPQEGSWLDRIVSQKFDFSTYTWNNGSYMGLNGSKDQDKEWAVVDTSNNTIYVTWTQFDKYGSSNPNDSSIILFSKSTDAGETWSDAMRINKIAGDCIDSDNTVEGAVPAVGPNGEVYVAWAGPEGIVFDRSTDGGNTWLDDDLFISDQPGGWDYDISGINRANGLPITCCDLSNSPYKGTIYVNWTDHRNGDTDTDVFIAKSTDGGDTWSAPIRVNDDPAGKEQFFTWMTVDEANGDVYVVFYDRRNYTDDNTDVYIARSVDGGETFQNTLISESPFLPYSNVFFGDYTNISAYNGKVRPIWTRLQNGDLSVLTAIIDFTVGNEEVLEATLAPVTLQQNYPNPFKETTTLAFKLSDPSRISLSVYDITGRKVAVLVNNEYRNTGKYIEHFNAVQYHLTDGVYYFVLETDGITKTQKVLLAN